MSDCVRKELTVSNSLGLHARPATMLAKLALSFQSEIVIERDGESVDATSALAILMMAAGGGSILTVSAVGPDAEKAVDAIAQLFDSKFGEE